MVASGHAIAAPSLGADHQRRRRHRVRWAIVGTATLFVVVMLSAALGPYPVSPSTVVAAVFEPTDSYDHRVVREIRIPRTILGLVVAAALAAAGALMMALTRNPLADPGILGVNAGAGTGVIIAVAVFGLTSFSDFIWFAFVGAVAATMLTYIVGSRGRGGGSPLRMTLTGVALGSVLGGVGSAISLLDPTTFDTTRFWSVGSINQGWDVVIGVLPFIAVGLVGAAVMAHQLNAISLGDDLASTLGVRLRLARTGTIAALTILCGAATAAAGPIVFVGFIVPHVARWIVGPDQRWILAYSLLLAPIALLSADLVGRMFLGGTLPVGLVTILFGAPIVIVLVRRGAVSGL